jgi:HPt (histidine-containing phosphotransfer) domain-containing protein
MATSTRDSTSIARVSRSLEPIFDQFLDIQWRYLDQLDHALVAGDVTCLHRLGHSIKGGAATYQLPEAAALGEGLEQAALERDLDAAAAFVRRLRRYYCSLCVIFAD